MGGGVKWSVLFACAIACGGPQRSEPVASPAEATPTEAARSPAPRLIVLPPAGEHRWVEAGAVTRGVEGGIRYERQGETVRVAETRFYSSIVRASKVEDGWLFVAEDGVVARSDEYLGALERVGEIAVELGAVPFDNASGGVCIVDRLGGVHLVREAGLEPSFEPVDGETALGCVMMPGDEPLPDRSFVWLDGGEVVRLSSPGTPIARSPDPLMIGRALAESLVRERRIAHGLPSPIDGPGAEEDEGEGQLSLSGRRAPVEDAIARAESLRAFRGDGLSSHLAWVGDAVLDLRTGDRGRFGEGCAARELNGPWLLLECGTDDGSLELRATRDGEAVTGWPWRDPSFAAGPEHALDCGSAAYRPEDLGDCSLLDRSGSDATPTGWADAPGAIVAAFGPEAIALEELGEPEYRGLPRSRERAVGGAFGSPPETPGAMDVFVARYRHRAHHFDGERWAPLRWVGDEPAGVRWPSFTPSGTIVAVTRPVGLATATPAGLVRRSLPEGASKVDSFDGERAVAAGEGRLWWTVDGGERWIPVELPVDGEVGDRWPRCGAAGCVAGRFGLLWDAAPAAIPPLHRPANALTRVGAFAPQPPHPEPERGLAAVRCDAPMPEERPQRDGECARVVVDGIPVRYCFRGQELEVRLGRGRPIRRPIRFRPDPDQFHVAFAARGWAFVVAGSFALVIAPGGVGVHRRAMWRGVLARLEGSGARQELRVETRGNLYRFDRRGAQIGLVRRIFEEPWLDGLSEDGELVVGASDGTLRVYDARTGEETQRHTFEQPIAALPCPEGTRALRFDAHSYGRPLLSFAVGANAPMTYYYPVARAAVVEGTLCFEGLDAGAHRVDLRPGGGTLNDPDGGEHECVYRWSDDGESP